jgi:hypothetical protein
MDARKEAQAAQSVDWERVEHSRPRPSLPKSLSERDGNT